MLIQMPTQTEPTPIPESPEQAMWCFIEDYEQTVNNPNPEENLPQHLIELASSIGRFAAQNHITLDGYIHAAGLDPTDLREQIAQDEVLTGQMNRLFKQVRNPETAKTGYTADLSKFGWINREGEVTLPIRHEKTSTLNYGLVDLTGLSRAATDTQEELINQGIFEGLRQDLRVRGIPKLWQGIKTGDFNLRSVSIGNRKKKDVPVEQSFNCTLPAYKIGVDGTRNRAIIVVLDTKGDEPLFGLAALYDHDDDGKIHRQLFLKQR